MDHIYMATHTLAEVSTGHLGETVEVLGNPTGNQKTPRRGWPPKTSGERFSLELLGEPFPEIPWDSSAKNPVDAFAGLYTHKNWASHL